MCDEKPEIQLFIKSSTIDREQKGSCPLCQQWFMAACILTEQGSLSFHVTIVDAESPPKEFKDLSQSKIFPVVKGIRGLDMRGQDIGEKLADDHERLEEFFESFGCPDLKRDGSVQKHFDDLYKHFNAFLVSGTGQARQRLFNHLEKLNSFLEGEDQIYVIKDAITYGDCYLMPRLHHIKVACREFADFEIPEKLFYVWRYLYEAYKTDAFQKTCPTDQDIIKHYEKKAKVFKPKKGVPSLQKSTYSFDIPESILETLGNQLERGGNGMDDSNQYEDYTSANIKAQSQVHAEDSFQEEVAEDAIYDDPDLPDVGAPSAEPPANASQERAPTPPPPRSTSPEPLRTASPARSASPVEAGSVEALEAGQTADSPEPTYEDPDDYSPANLPPLPPVEDHASTPVSQYLLPEGGPTAADEDAPAPDYDAPSLDDYDAPSMPDTSASQIPDYDATPQPDYDAMPQPDYDATPQPDYDATTQQHYDKDATPKPDYDLTPETDEVQVSGLVTTPPAGEERTPSPYRDDSMTYESVEATDPEQSASTKSVDFAVEGKTEDTSDNKSAEIRVNGTNVTNGHE